MTWANAKVEASTVSAYSVLQPITAALICFMVPPTSKAYQAPAVKDLGVVPIAIGLNLVIFGQAMLRKCGCLPPAEEEEQGGAGSNGDGFDDGAWPKAEDGRGYLLDKASEGSGY